MSGGECGVTDDNLWRPTRRAEEHNTKDNPSTRRGAVHSIGWLCPSPVRRNTDHPYESGHVRRDDLRALWARDWVNHHDWPWRTGPQIERNSF
jgi:hypothetical protein